MSEGVVWDFSSWNNPPITNDVESYPVYDSCGEGFLDYSHELSNRRITTIHYYMGTFGFKKRLKDKTYIRKGYLKGFVPIRGVFQYSVRRDKYRTNVSRYLDENTMDEKIILIPKKLSGNRFIYEEERCELSIKEFLLGHIGDNRLRCKYLLFGVCNNKMVCLSFPIKVYLELEKIVDLTDVINNGYSMDILNDIIDCSFDSLSISTERHIVDDSIKSKINNVINTHNQRVEGRLNFLDIGG